jgi:putative aldouronate transport system substrate-binding protein
MKRKISLLVAAVMLAALCSAMPAFAEEAPLLAEPVTLTIFIDHSWYPVETFTGIIPEEITRLTNVSLDPTIGIDAEQLGVMIASGDLPDIVYTQNMVDRMSDPEVSYSYEDLIAQYEVDWPLSDKQLGIGRGYSVDGTAYTILNHYSEKADWEGVVGAAPMVGSLAVRGDLLEAIGNPPLESLDDLYNAFGLIKEAFPDVVPLKLNQDWNILVLRYLTGMGGTDFLEQEDGSYLHYSVDPRYKDILMWVNKCYQAGYVISDDPYFVRGSTAIATDKFFAQLTCTQNGIPGTNGDLSLIDPSYYLFELTPFAESNYVTADLGWSGSFIPLSNRNPEATIKFIAWMFTPEAQALTQMGREGIEYTLSAEGLPEFSQEWADAIAAGSATHNKVFNPWFYLGGSEIVEAVTRCATTDQKLVGEAYKVISERFDNNPWIKAGEPIGDIDEKAVFDKIKELSSTYDRKIILAENDEAAEAMYQEFITNAERTGIQRLDEYVTDKIKEAMPLYQ